MPIQATILPEVDMLTRTAEMREALQDVVADLLWAPIGDRDAIATKRDFQIMLAVMQGIVGDLNRGIAAMDAAGAEAARLKQDSQTVEYLWRGSQTRWKR